MVVAMVVENGIRVLIPVTGAASLYGGYKLGEELGEETIEFFEDGATVTPLKLTPEEERQMQEDAARVLQEELDAANAADN